MSKENKIFTFILSLIFCGAALVWYLKHPSSPFYKKEIYFFEFDQLGTLGLDAKVRVNGLLMGKVLSVELTEYKAQAKVSLSTQVKLPKDSKVNIVNVGLVGERVLDIKLGDATDYYRPGDVVRGQYDMGSVALVVTAVKALGELSEIVASVRGVLDETIFDPRIERTWLRLKKRTKYLTLAIQKLRSGSTRDFDSLFNGLDSLKSNMVLFLDEAEINFNQVAESSNEMVKTGERLSDHLVLLSQELAQLRAATQDSTAGMIYHVMHDPQFQAELDSTLVSWRGLQEMIYNRRHILNVDVF